MTWKYKFNHLQFILVLLVFQVVIGWFHELTHGIAGLLGGGIVKGVQIGTGVFFIEFSTDPTGVWGYIMPYAGGFGAALVCLLLWWASDLDPDVRIAFYTIGLTHLFYGITEGVMFNHFNAQYAVWNNIIGLVAMIVANIYAVFTAKELWILEEIENNGS